MKVSEAHTLIKDALPQKRKSTWADLGCGNGIFTNALAGLIGTGSKIYAIDREKHLVDSVVDSVEIEFIQTNFETDQLPINNLDGILMANSLHYVNNKSAFIKKIRNVLKVEGQLILVEYDTEKPNAWIPYPINFSKLTELLKDHGFTQIQKIGERQSIYRSEKMYACLVEGLRIQ